jgi:phage terminase large subunit
MDLTKKQIEGYDILNSGLYKDVSFYGSGRSGKTFLSTYFIFERALKYPGSFHLFLRSTYTSLLAGVFSQTIPNVLNALKIHPGIDLVELKFCHLRQNPAEVIFSNGSSIRFLGLDTVSTNKQATDKILSQEYLTADFEEANEIPFEVVEKVKTRLAQKMEGVFLFRFLHLTRQPLIHGIINILLIRSILNQKNLLIILIRSLHYFSM